MGRGGCFLFVLVVLLGLVVGYDQFRIEQMRGQVGAIANKLHLSPQGKKTGAGGTDLATALANVENHTKRAKALLRSNKEKEAQIELDKALKSLKSANNVSNDIVGDIANSMGVAKERLVAAFQDAQKAISKEAKPKRTEIK